MNGKNILVVEDRPALRGLLQGGLEKRGFRVASAADEKEAEEKSRNFGADLDVVLLDIELGTGGNGLDFGMRLKQEWSRQNRLLPEFLIFTAHDKPNYYQTAIQLGAAAYLQKGELGGDPNDPVTPRPVRIDRVAHHVRALALRRALRNDRPGRAEEIQTIARTSQSLEDALKRFCRDLLSVELEGAFGGDFVLLLSGPHQRTVRFVRSRLELDSSGLLERIHEAVHSRLGEAEPLVFEARDPSWGRDLPPDEYGQVSKSLDQLDGAAFIPLGETRGYRLTLGLASDDRSAAESTVEFARILGRYLNPTVVTHWLELTGLWAAMDMERRTLLKATSDFCTYQGQELQTLLQEAEEQAKEQDGKIPMGKLHAVAQELRGAGDMLAQVVLLADRESGGKGSKTIEMDELLRYRWSTIVSGHLRLPETPLQVDGKCTVDAPEVEVEKAVSQVFFWLGRRLTRLPRRENAPQEIRCILDQEGDRATILFEEQTSRRMPKRMRDLLFAPFTSLPLPEPREDLADETLKGYRLGLYLARILAESVGGSLEEASDAIPGDFGHRFILELPAAR